jgi:nucleotide-binding universal stress UspA family protein
MEAGSTGSIVVGFDGSDESEKALAWATGEAKLRNAKLKLVSAWEITGLVYAYGYVPSISPSLEEEARERAQLLLDERAEQVRATTGVDVETETRQGQAADALVEAANGADLLVVGSRGHGGFTGLLLGSVSTQCAHHARCPVVIVR